MPVVDVERPGAPVPAAPGPGARLIATRALLLFPAFATLLLCFASGGYFAGTTGRATVAILALLAARAGVGRAAQGRPLVACLAVGGAMIALTGWTLLSERWSHAPGAALLAFDRTLLYSATFLLFASLGSSLPRLRLLVRGLAMALAAVCVVALIAHVVPGLSPADATPLSPSRLSYPLSYWNAAGLLAALTLLLGLHLTADEQESEPVKVAAAALVPIAASVLAFSVSRGALWSLVVGLVVYVAVARPRATVAALVSVVPGGLIAVLAVMRGGMLDSTAWVGGAHPSVTVTALGVVGGTLGAGAARVLLLDRDARWGLGSATWRQHRGLLLGAAIALAVLGGGLAVGLHVPARMHAAAQHFLSGADVSDRTNSEGAGRLLSASSNGRTELWHVARQGLSAQPVHGTGAGTFASEWLRARPDNGMAHQAHSVYLQTAGELGLVGLALLVVALGGILGAFLRNARGEGRAVHGLLFAAGVTWCVHAGVDWDWEMPAVTLWLFAAGGLVLGPRARVASDARMPLRRWWPARAAMALACLALLVLPARVAVSDARLATTARALIADDCATVARASRQARAAIGSRPQAFQGPAICAYRHHRPAEALAAARAGLRQAPAAWELHYLEALALAQMGQDPRPALAAALALNPQEPAMRQLAPVFALGTTPAQWAHAGLFALIPPLLPPHSAPESAMTGGATSLAG